MQSPSAPTSDCTRSATPPVMTGHPITQGCPVFDDTGAGPNGPAPTRSDHTGRGHIAAAEAPRQPRTAVRSPHAAASATAGERRPAPVPPRQTAAQRRDPPSLPACRLSPPRGAAAAHGQATEDYGPRAPLHQKCALCEVYQLCALCAKLPLMSEQTITATHLRQNLGAVLDSVLRGRTVHVIRNGRPLCTLQPPMAPTKNEGSADDFHPDHDRGQSDR